MSIAIPLAQASPSTKSLHAAPISRVIDTAFCAIAIVAAAPAIRTTPAPIASDFFHWERTDFESDDEGLDLSRTTSSSAAAAAAFVPVLASRRTLLLSGRGGRFVGRQIRTGSSRRAPRENLVSV